ncbi:MAG: PqqD family protein [Candidatus Electrothrix aestuarii]|uniref:PqqD family protein n=1 Tax=Candidatus Electrothrix aestuarii TaxID=3062594 RepID=A0AAU8LWE2_9BACT|nr:PqqD family protein [Candidatus Electrothrix aestuarii]
MKNSHKFTLNPDFTTEAFDDEILLYAISTGKGIYLNKTAGLVLELCGKGASIQEIITLLEETYPEEKDDIQRDVGTAVETLLAHKALLEVDEQEDEQSNG